MACTAPTSASEVFCRASKCNRLMGRVLIALAVVLTVVIAKGGAEFIRNSTAGNVGTAERIVGFVAIFAAEFALLLTALFFARRRASAAHHAMVKANNLKALELLAASASDEATKKDILARAADLVAGKPGCCK
jgi:Zn-dependent protease with chaperone function